MIDLHIHTTHSDGLPSVKDILTLAEEKKLDYISKDAVMAGLNGFLDAFIKAQPLVKVDDPFEIDKN